MHRIDISQRYELLAVVMDPLSYRARHQIGLGVESSLSDVAYLEPPIYVFQQVLVQNHL